nr:unknown [Zea mays]
MDAMMDASREFFRQPLQEKQKHSNMIDGKHFQLQGYGNDRVASEDQVLDWCDRLYLLVEPQEDRSLDLWPACLRDVLHDFTTECTRVKDCLLREMAKALDELGDDDDYFIDQFGDRADTHARRQRRRASGFPGRSLVRRAHQTSHPARQSRRPNRDNKQWDLQEPSAPGCNKRGEREAISGSVLFYRS